MRTPFLATPPSFSSSYFTLRTTFLTVLGISIWAVPNEAMKVAELASKAFIKRILKNPYSPSCVLSFYYGIDYNVPEDRQILKDGVAIRDMEELWYRGGPKYDELCQPFAPLIQQAGQSKLEGEAWESTVDGCVAQLILCDQLSRNAFRGSQEAFAYDETALFHARRIAAKILNWEPIPDLSGEIYPHFMYNAVIAFMHSEAQEDHEKAVSILNFAKATTSDRLQELWDEQMSFEMDHKKVVDRFGRYPHRNAAKGRESTKEELEWLADVDNLPGWALSQISPPPTEVGTDSKEL